VSTFSFWTCGAMQPAARMLKMLGCERGDGGHGCVSGAGASGGWAGGGVCVGAAGGEGAAMGGNGSIEVERRSMHQNERHNSTHTPITIHPFAPTHAQARRRAAVPPHLDQQRTHELAAHEVAQRPLHLPLVRAHHQIHALQHLNGALRRARRVRCGWRRCWRARCGRRAAALAHKIALLGGRRESAGCERGEVSASLATPPTCRHTEPLAHQTGRHVHASHPACRAEAPPSQPARPSYAPFPFSATRADVS
jgi:hypothetical protein